MDWKRNIKVKALLLISAAILLFYFSYSATLNNVYYISKGIYPVDHSHDSCEATIVTAYFRMTSKHSHDEYLEWMRNMLSLRDCMVVFTQSDLVDTIKSLRPVYFPTRIISTNITQAKAYLMLSPEEWERQEQMDPEQEIGHNRALYTVWGEKTNFMKIAADENYFQSSYFLWLDIGAVRHPGNRYKKLIQRLPTESGVLLLNINPFTKEERTLHDGESRVDFSREDRLGGGTIGCDTRALEAWHREYYATMNRYLHRGQFVGKDQNIMATTCLETGLCLLVDGDNHSWFKLQDWLIGNLPKQKYHRLNQEQYHRQTQTQKIDDAQETPKPCATPLCAEKWTKRPTGPLEIYREKERESSKF